MTNDKTTALIEAARRQGFENRFRGTMLDLTRDIFPRDHFYKSSDTNAAWEGYQSAWEEALAAFGQPTLRMVGAQCSCGKQMTVTQEYPFEQPAVREMTANEIEKLITQRCHEITMLTAKLGTIRVVES